jgi:hypothetical protein
MTVEIPCAFPLTWLSGITPTSHMSVPFGCTTR